MSKARRSKSSDGSDPGSKANVEAHAERLRAEADVPITLSLSDAAELVAHDIDIRNFAQSAFDALARDVDTLSDFAEQHVESSYEGWQLFQNLATRMRFAGTVVAQLRTRSSEESAVQS